jgi:AcrR family transcriptional regulator
MFHKGLNKEIIVDAAKELIEENGFGDFSMRRLADKLEIKTASLYTHIESMEALFTEVGLSVLKQQRDCLLGAIGETRADSAVTALAECYRRFALEHTELYRLIMQMPSGNDKVLKEAAAMTAEPFMRVLDDYSLSDECKMHCQRMLRAMMHGFVSEELSGYFSHYPVSADESYRLSVACVIDGLHKKESEILG